MDVSLTGWRCRAVAQRALWVVALGTAVAAAPTAVAQYRSIDGSGNNLANSDWGAAGVTLLRIVPHGYEDLADLADGDRASPRVISNIVCAQTAAVANDVNASDLVWQWGQFLDHDIDLTPVLLDDPADIPVPPGDPWFDPDGTGAQVISFERSAFENGELTPRQQINAITAFIDASNVYGSDPIRAAALRTNDGTGRLKMSEHRLLPFNVDGLPNAGGPDPTLYLAGDVRANEQVALTAMHTLFVREHNRLANVIWEEDPSLSGEEIYQRARAIVGAQMQVITYREFLPVVLGPGALSAWSGYDASVNPGISNLFSTAAYRFGHSMLSPALLRLKRNGGAIPTGHLQLRDAFFAPHELEPAFGKGIEPLLRGLATQTAQDTDVRIVDGVRNFLFGLPGQGGFDLASLNIQRGRDHGLPAYNETRIALGLAPAGSFADITADGLVQAQLALAYGDVDDIDVWVGGLAEDHVPGALVGELFWTVIKGQFEALRDGDRFWYENVFSDEEIEELEATTLTDVIRRNTKIKNEIQDNPFLIGAGA